ncbi:MAG: type II secretion system F family protein [Planctomycetes bacterium]|nr:type II secretion system F family protein [Planctomycetota bacterium]
MEDLAAQGFVLSFIFAAVTIFVTVGFSLFSEGWTTYEEKYVSGAERTLESMFLSIPPQQLIYLSAFTGTLGFFGVLLATQEMVWSVLTGLAGVFVPEVTIRLLRWKRARRFQEQLVDLLQSLTNSLRAGIALPMAFESARHEMPNPMAQEIGLLTQELKLGASLDAALRHMLERMPGEDLDLVITAIEISGEVGGNLTEVFGKISHTIRDRSRIERRISALTAMGRLQGLVMGLLPLAFLLGIYLMQPEYILPLFTTWTGNAILGVIAVLEVMGFWFIRKIVNIEV